MISKWGEVEEEGGWEASLWMKRTVDGAGPSSFSRGLVEQTVGIKPK